jgi:hypothetical protein
MNILMEDNLAVILFGPLTVFFGGGFLYRMMKRRRAVPSIHSVAVRFLPICAD